MKNPGTWVQTNALHLYTQMLAPKANMTVQSPSLFASICASANSFSISWADNVPPAVRYIVFPAHVNRNHFITFMVDQETRHVLVFDSLAHVTPRLREHANCVADAFGILHWSAFTVEIVSCPSQSNDYDCGIFTLTNLRALWEGIHPYRISEWACFPNSDWFKELWAIKLRNHFANELEQQTLTQCAIFM